MAYKLLIRAFAIKLLCNNHLALISYDALLIFIVMLRAGC